jgi:hypothetical protein
MKNTINIGIIISVIYPINVLAEPIQWTVEEGGNGHYYELITTPFRNWHDAKIHAEALGGYLVTLTTEEENVWVYNNMGGEPTWLGGVKEEGNNIWTWVTGETWSYTSWATNEPNAPPESQVALEYITTSPHLWNDQGQHVERVFIIEYDNSPIPPPPPACEATTLSPDLELYIPRLEYKTAFGIIIPLQIDMRYVDNDEEQLLFEVKDFEILPE